MSRETNSSGDGLSSARCGERTPLRSLENEMLSTPSSRFKSKSLHAAHVKMTEQGDAHLCDPDPHLQSAPSNQVLQTTAFSFDIATAATACGIGDVTFQSFICPGGQVEIADSSACAEESIILPKDQAVKNTRETDDTGISDSMILQSCSDHIEHPYHNPEMKNVSLVAIDTSCLCENSKTSEAFRVLNDKITTKDYTAIQLDFYENKDVTWKSFFCDGGEVEVANVRLQDDAIPLPKVQLGEHLQEHSVNIMNLSDSEQTCQAEHSDHPYYSNENNVCVIATCSETKNGIEEPANGLNDVIFKSLNCTGGEIQISDGSVLANATVPLPADQTAACKGSYSYDAHASMFAFDQEVQNITNHLDHPYCNIEGFPSTLNGHLDISQEPLPFRLGDVDKAKHTNFVLTDGQTNREECVTSVPFISSSSEVEELDSAVLSRKASALPDAQVVISQPFEYNNIPTSIVQDQMKENYKQPDRQNVEVVDTDSPAIGTSSMTNSSLKKLVDKSINSQMQETSKKDCTSPSVPCQVESSQCSNLAASARSPTPVKVYLECNSHTDPSCRLHPTSEAKDSALGSPGSDPVLSNKEKRHTENFHDVLKVLSECPSVASALQFGLLSPAIRRASLLVSEAKKDSSVNEVLADDSALEVERSLLAPVSVNPTGLWTEHLESPIPRPMFNSTALLCKARLDPVTDPAEDVSPKPPATPQPKVETANMEIPLIPDGRLQQQLRQMAEFLYLASGKIGPAAQSEPFLPPEVVTVPSAKVRPLESHSVCVGTTPMKCVDHSINTSGQFERRRDFSVMDSCTLTDPLLWNLPPGSLESLSRQELEQRLRSSMITVEALVQQLATARTYGCPAVPAPSDLREKLVQTDHTELSQTTMHRDLYLEALRRIGELELDGSSLQNLIQSMQDMRISMTSLSCDTDAVLSNMKRVGDLAREDNQSLVSHYVQMKSLLGKTKQTHAAMMQKVKDALHQRDDMRIQMEEAFTAKEAAFSVMEQLRTHCAKEISELQRILESQQELSAALDKTYPELVALNQAFTETLNSVSAVLSATIKEQSSLMGELCTVRGHLHKTVPMLLRLNEKTAAALKERDEHLSAREQAVEEREQMKEEWNQTNLSLQTAREQIGDLSLQVTILTSEMGVLRQKITEKEEERGQLERKVTELSATVSSTLASYTFLEQALTAETTKLQQSWKDIQRAREKANELEMLLGQSEQRVCELSQALAQSEEQLGQLQTLSKSQNMEIQQLQDVCTQLSGVREMNEFLQMENELAREQMAESERMLRANLQGLRERNIECEDLKVELSRIQLENKSLQEELDTTRSKSSATQLELGEKLAQAATEITLLHHTLRGLTNELNAALNDQRAEPLKDKESQAVHNVERRHPSSSFVDSVMVALTAEKEEDVNIEASPGSAVPSEMSEPQCETMFSETSAFTRIAAVTPKKTLKAAELETEEDEQRSFAKLFTGLDSTVTELINTMNLVRQHKDAQVEELCNTICGLQVELETANNRHQAEVFELKHQLSRFNSLVEKGNQALQQKAQDEKTLTTLMYEIQEIQEILNKQKTENNELRKEVVELRRSLQQSKVESEFLRGELRKAGGQAAPPAHFMEEKIQLLKEVKRLKSSLQEVEQARVKLLDRAKRHQIIHQTNQQKSENELQLLNSMINKVRETLLSLPDVVKNSEPLQHLVEYIG